MIFVCNCFNKKWFFIEPLDNQNSTPFIDSSRNSDSSEEKMVFQETFDRETVHANPQSDQYFTNVQAQFREQQTTIQVDMPLILNSITYAKTTCDDLSGDFRTNFYLKKRLIGL
jgi:hypothetical protein